MLMVIYVPIVFVLSHAQAVLLFLKQDAEVAQNAQAYIFSYIPALIFLGLNDSQRKFLNMMELSRIPLYC